MTSYDSLQPPHCASEVSFSSLSIFTLCANRSLIRLQNYAERVLCSIEYRVSSFNWISRKHRIRPFLILETRDSNCSNPHAEPVTRWCSAGTLYNSNWKLSLAELIDKPGHQSAAAALQLCAVQCNTPIRCSILGG